MLRRLVLLMAIGLSLLGAGVGGGLAEPCDVSHYKGTNLQSCRSVNEAARQTDGGNPETAIAILKDVPTEAAAGVEPEVTELVKSERIRAQRDAAIEAKHNAGALATFWAGLVTKAATLASWLALLGIAVILLLLLAQIPKRKDPLASTLISFVDQAGDKTSDAANLALSYDVNRLLNPPAETGLDDVMQQRPGGGEGATFIDLQPLLGASSFATALGSAADLDLGGFKISSKAVVQAWTVAMKPRYSFTLRGVLSKTDDTTIVYAQMLDSNGKRMEDEEWSAKAQGVGARDAALREVMARVTICHSKEEPPTKVWQSLSFFWQAMDTCRDDMSPATLTIAQGLLQKALKYDPSNWMARYNNALFLQMTGDYKSALENWTFLLTELTRGHADENTHDQGKTALLAKVNYNRALTLARMGDWNELKQAVAILEALIASDAHDLKWLAKSALASALSTVYGLMLESEKETEAKNQKREAEKNAKQAADTQPVAAPAATKAAKKVSAPEQTREQMNALTKELIEQLETQKTTPRNLLLANAMARNARGALLLNAGQYGAALKDFDAAILLNPELIDSQLNAARAVRRQKGRDWCLQTEMYLKTALQLDAMNREAHFLMGSLYLDPAVYRLKDAAGQFELAAPHSWAAYQLGVLYTTPQFGVPDDSKALECFRRSVRLGDAVDIRALDLVRLLLDMVNDQVSTNLKADAAATTDKPAGKSLLSHYELMEMVGEAQQVAKRIRRRARRSEDARKASELGQQAQNLAKGLQQPTDDTVPLAQAPAEGLERAKVEGVSQPAAEGLKQGDDLPHDGDQA